MSDTMFYQLMGALWLIITIQAHSNHLNLVVIIAGIACILSFLIALLGNFTGRRRK